MGLVRTFAETDIPAVAKLYTETFPSDKMPEAPRIVSYFRELFFNNPWCEMGLQSLVYEESDGHIAGFVGVLPRRMLANGKPIVVVVTLHFMVEPSSRTRLAGIELCRKVFQGSQDLTLTDGASDLGRKVWEGLGGSKAILYSMYWTRPLRPTRYVMSRLSKHKYLSPAKYISLPFCILADALVTRLVPSQLHLKPKESGYDLDIGTYLNYLSDFTKSEYMRPHYDPPTLEWLFLKAANRKDVGQFHKIAVQNAKQEIIGWYLYYLVPGGISSVLQLAGRADSVKEVLDHLFYHCWAGGSLAVSGRLEPPYIQQLSDKYCVFDRRGPWVLIHSRRPEILHAIQQGSAFLTRLEGEWCARLEGSGF
jgi:hypothetical protein